MIFYLPDRKLFIEINGVWTHNDHWFNKHNKMYIHQVYKWKNKCTKFYNNAIEVWSNLDVRKRETAKQNKLNYIVLWNKRDIEDWFKLNCPIGQD